MLLRPAQKATPPPTSEAVEMAKGREEGIALNGAVKLDSWHSLACLMVAEQSCAGSFSAGSTHTSRGYLSEGLFPNLCTSAPKKRQSEP